MSGGAVASLDALLDGGVWFRVEAAGTAAAVRRAAERLATELGMPERRIADLSIVAAEAAGNLVKHADEGVLLVRVVRAAGLAGVEIIAIDRGPGMADVARSVGDRHSTAGTLGIGLGAIVRQAGWTDLHSVPGPYPGLLTHSPQVIAATVLGDAGTRRDDAGVLVARLP